MLAPGLGPFQARRVCGEVVVEIALLPGSAYGWPAGPLGLRLQSLGPRCLRCLRCRSRFPRLKAFPDAALFLEESPA